LIDLSGTLHIEDQVVPGSLQALEKLRGAGLKVKFVTNTTKESKNLLFRNLIKLGFKIEKDEIFTSLTAARSVIDEKKLRPFLLLEDCALEDFAGVDTDNPNAVVVGLAPSKFNYENLNKAFDLLLNGACLVAIHKGRYYKKADNKLHLGPGPFVAALENATGVIAEVVGKPEDKFFYSAIRSLQPPSSSSSPLPQSLLSGVIMIGDDIRDDVIGAIRAGLTGILVKTGKY
ncbi:hypothetical protein HELRODRAFT_134995, partial [Helobdella robusta]|uniref:Haloacid dehalogenase-like hydrolase domain-containing protein 2 n=1 Tax=Helobdella robusta TaxID=6412 RepID=T1EI66_HELRO